jgi:membrane-associated protein
LFDSIREFIKLVLDVPRFFATLIAIGVWTLPAIIFAETGLLVGFFLPGDSLLVVTGLYASQGVVPINFWLLNLILIVAAVAGDALGYWLGSRTGKALYSRKDSLLFRREHLMRTHEFYEKHGGKTIVLARFMPIIRTFAPVVAGAAGMTYRRFVTYNVVGGVSWIVSMTSIGYYLCSVFPGLAKHVEKVAIVIVFLSILPGLIPYLKSKMKPPRSGNGKPGESAAAVTTA